MPELELGFWRGHTTISAFALERSEMFFFILSFSLCFLSPQESFVYRFQGFKDDEQRTFEQHLNGSCLIDTQSVVLQKKFLVSRGSNRSSVASLIL